MVGKERREKEEMMIVKLTILSFVITGIYLFCFKIWAESDKKRAVLAALTNNFPKWTYPFALFVLLDVIGILTSAIYLLFIR